MSTDNTVTIHVAAEAVTRLVSNNSPALAARFALADFEGEFGRLPPGSFVEVAWQADSEGQPGERCYTALDAVRAALPGAEPAPASPPFSAPPSPVPGFEEWWAGIAPRTLDEEPAPSAVWAAALAWAAGLAEGAGCFCGEPGEAIGNHDPRCPIALAAAIRAGRP